MERKIIPAYTLKADADQGIVEHIVAVMGNIDEGGDVIHNGAFTKTITERGGKVRVLDNHNTDSISSVIGKPLGLREVGRDQLPGDLTRDFPDATGALVATTQYLMSTPEGKGAFERIKAGAVDEYSIGYDALDKDFSKITRDGKDTTVRNLRTLKLYEYSPVIWAMNPATTTLSAKASEPNEEKPWAAVQEGDKWVVYKVDEDGEPTGDPLGSHDSEDEAAEQIRALYAAENEDEDKASEKAGRVLARRNADRIVAAVMALQEALADAGINIEIEEEDEPEDEMTAEKSADNEQQAGPGDCPPTTGAKLGDRERLLKLYEIEQKRLEVDALI